MCPRRQKLFSIVIPAHNEAENIAGTVRRLHRVLEEASIDHEIIVVNDHSNDATQQSVERLQQAIANLRCLNNTLQQGYGRAVRLGLSDFRGDAVAIVMADGSDDPYDLVTFHQKLLQGYDCVFGSRFIRGGQAAGYPLLKLAFNRIGNIVPRTLFVLDCDDMTNAFKAFRREVISVVQPLKARHFDLSVELPLKAVIRGCSYTTVATRWTDRRKGRSSFRIVLMVPRYLKVITTCFWEKLQRKLISHFRDKDPTASDE